MYDEHDILALGYDIHGIAHLVVRALGVCDEGEAYGVLTRTVLLYVVYRCGVDACAAVEVGSIRQILEIVTGDDCRHSGDKEKCFCVSSHVFVFFFFFFLSCSLSFLLGALLAGAEMLP